MRVIASLIATAIIIGAWALVAHSQSTVTTTCNAGYTVCATTTSVAPPAV